MKFAIRIGALLAAVVAAGGARVAGGATIAGGATAAASRAAPATYGSPRDWGDTQIRSLDPTRLPAATARLSDAVPERTSRRDQLLSNEKTFTRWAYVTHIAWIRQSPVISSRRIQRLSWYTADGFASIYLLLRAHRNHRGQEWIKLRIPGRPNGRTGWVQSNTLGSFHLTHLRLVVDRGRRQMQFYNRGREIWTAPVGVGKPGTPTPAGHFWIDERFKITNPSSGYYPYAFGTTDYSTLSDWPGGGVVGIHGPYYDPQGIPGYISHGCIRLRVSDDFWLASHLQLGAPLQVI